MGLQFSCNVSRGLISHGSGNGEYIVNGSISPLQGSTFSPTGNVFAHDCYSAVSDFDFNGSQGILYYHRANDIPQTPECFNGINPTPINLTNPDCGIINRLADLKLEELLDITKKLNSQIQEKAAELNILLDGGQSKNLLQQLKQGSEHDIQSDIKNLDIYRNLVSVDVIRELLNRSNGELSVSLIQLIKENPSVLGDPIISDQVHGYIDYQTLQQNHPSRAQLEDNLMRLNKEKFTTIREATRQIFEEDRFGISNRMDQYRSVLSARQDLFGCIQTIQSYVYELNLDAAYLYVNGLDENSTTIRDFNQDELTDYMEIISILDAAEKDYRPQHLLVKDELNRLFDLSKKETKFASVKAKNILKYYYNDIYENSITYQ